MALVKRSDAYDQPRSRSSLERRDPSEEFAISDNGRLDFDAVIGRSMHVLERQLVQDGQIPSSMPAATTVTTASVG